MDAAETVKIHGKWIPVKASVEVIDGLSGHADYLEISDWLKNSQLQRDTKIMLVHGEPKALESMRDHLGRTTQYTVETASYRSVINV